MDTYSCTAYFNQNTRDSMFYGFDAERDGVLVESMLAPMQVQAPTARAAADDVFRRLNADSRPNGRFERSLSVGDVVKVERPCCGQHAPEVTWWACENVGWRSLDTAPATTFRPSEDDPRFDPDLARLLAD